MAGDEAAIYHGEEPPFIVETHLADPSMTRFDQTMMMT